MDSYTSLATLYVNVGRRIHKTLFCRKPGSGNKDNHVIKFTAEIVKLIKVQFAF